MVNIEQIKIIISKNIDGQATSDEIKLMEEYIHTYPELMKYKIEMEKLSVTLRAWPDEDLSPDLEVKLYRGLKEGNMDSNNKFKFATAGFGGGAVVVIILMVIVGHFSKVNYDKTNPYAETKIIRIEDNKANKEEEKGLPDAVGKQLMNATEALSAINPESFVKKGKHGHLKSDANDVGGQYAPTNEDVVTKYEPYSLEANYSKSNSPASTGSDGTILLQKASREEVPVNYSRARQAGGATNALFEISDEVWGPNPTTIQPEPRVIEYSQGSTEDYDKINENRFKNVLDSPVSTFSIDVDTASYSNVRRFLNQGQLPPIDAVRIEELINYFSYNYPEPENNEAFSITTDAAICPWNTNHKLIRVGLQGQTLRGKEVPASNLVFLIDVSGSMNSANKLPLLKKAYTMMAQQLSANERVAIVVYAGAAGVVLPSTPASNQYAITDAINRLNAGGSTAGGAGIQMAYKIARENFIPGGNNRVILATDGDFNVGVSSDSEMTRLIEKEREAGVFLTILGFGTGNNKDNKMEKIADNGNGTYHYIDTEQEAKKVLVHELGSTLFNIAKDVKIQIEFNPLQVKSYRLIGYENRLLNREDFNDDTKDAGELGAGHTVTALYEIVPAGSYEDNADVDPLIYQQKRPVRSGDLMTIKLRYKEPNGTKSKLITQSVRSEDIRSVVKNDFQWAASVAEFGLLLRNSEHKGSSSYQHVLNSAYESKGDDTYGYRKEFIRLVQQAQQLDNRVYQQPQPEPWLSDNQDQPSGIQFK